ncbi:MAG TPA: glucuronate isomerase [Polyangiaceae bacterium]|nr:glucuronate isomerase [Polyangiaceae bacterium]
MTKPAIYCDDFLLETELARRLYHEHAARQPIIDYHCHLPPDRIASDHQFASVSQIWLEGDHYKWRAMRADGVPERFCTGDAGDWEKFEAWAATVPHTLRNPLWHWTHLELKNPFGIRDRLLGPETARGIYEQCNTRLAAGDLSTQGLLRHFRVLVVCTTDDPVDTLEHHRSLKSSAAARFTRVYPTWRPDRALGVEQPGPFNAWLERLEAASGRSIASYRDLLDALAARHAVFHEHGCRLSDHGLETTYAEEYGAREVESAFSELRRGKPITPQAALQYKSALLYDLALLDHQRGWTQQFHLGALRNNNTRLLHSLGPDTGFDSMGDFEIARPLSRFLDRLDASNQLARTIVYNLNPADNEVIATMMGNFQDGTVPGKMQYGSAWWFLDQLDGMEKQLNSLSNMGLLSRFVGMLTDSRSFLSYSRHEYFRRLLCNLLGNDVRRGLLPDDAGLLGQMVQDICFENARQYFGLELPPAFEGPRPSS